MKQFYDHYSEIKVANDGEVWLPQNWTHKEHFTYGYLHHCGHRYVCYHRKNYPVHVLVAEVFLNNNQPIPKGYDVHHINGNPEDNRPENLRILPHGEHQKLHKCENHPNLKPVIGVHKETGKEVRFESQSEAQRALGVSQRHISDCCRGKIKSSGGYIWRYA